MRLLKTIFVLVTIVLVLSCEEENVATHDVIQIKADKTQLNADGTSTATIIAYIPLDALPSKRTVSFKTYIGTLEDSLADSKAKKITLKADKKTGDYWTATTRFTSGLDAVNVPVYASIEGFVDSVVIKHNLATATSIRLNADAFGVPIGYTGEINLVATLSSATGKASKGQKVKFTDTYENGTAVGGSFRSLQASSDDNSQAKATYSPGPVTPGSYVIIRAILLNSAGEETNVQNSVKIYIKPE